MPCWFWILIFFIGFEIHTSSSASNRGTVAVENTLNTTTSPTAEEDVLFFKITSFINLFTSILGAIGNTFVLVASTKTWNISVHYKLTAALGLSDLLFSVIYFFYIVQYIVWSSWVYHPVMCKIFEPISSTTIYLDIGFIVIIALERYAGICFPLKGGFSVRTIACLSIFNVFFALVSAFPLPVILVHSAEQKGCIESWPNIIHAKVYTVYLLTIYFLIPMLMLSILYYKSVATLKRVTQSLTCSNDAARCRKYDENRRILYIVSCLVVAFFLLVLPSWLCFLILDYVAVTAQGRDLMDAVSSLTFPMHTLCNPIIYSFVDRKVRSILFGKRKRNRLNSAAQVTKTTHV